MAERHHINSDEFEQWLDIVIRDESGWGRSDVPREVLYDLWVEGYSAWEVPGLIG